MAKPQIEPKVLKGFRDQLPELTIPRQKMLQSLEQVFCSFGFVPIDTPALEYSEILLGKGSAETDKQMYRFLDNGGRDVALRFDLTIPLARFVAMNINELGTPFKRYHIAPVWRAEKPQRGRYREFIQCDFDIIGVDSVLADAEIAGVIHQGLKSLGIGHQIRVNDRSILNGLLDSLSVRERSTEILRAIDKLEKQGVEVVRAELGTEAGLNESQISQIFDLVAISKGTKSNADVLSALQSILKNSPEALKGVSRLAELANVVSAFELGEKEFRLDLSIARGLDYYTGTVFETTFLDLPAIGSICSGGRYDNLANLYTSRHLPGVGASIGLDRILGALEELKRFANKSSTARVLITVIDESTVQPCVQLGHQLRSSGIDVEVYPELGKLGNQLKYASRRGIDFAVIAGSRELADNVVSIKDLRSGEQRDRVPLGQAGVVLRELLVQS